MTNTMFDHRTGRYYLHLPVIRPLSYRGNMRLYVDRIDAIDDDQCGTCRVWWRRTPRLGEEDAVVLAVGLRAADVRAMLRKCGWQEQVREVKRHAE